MPPTPLAMTLTDDLVGADLRQRVAQRLGAALHVRLDDELDRLRRPPRPSARTRPRSSWQRRASRTSRNLPWRYSATSRALRSLSTTSRSSPAFGGSDRPSTCTGTAGPASATCLPVASNSARTRPNSWPAMIGSPARSVPRLTSTVATGPRPFSMLDSSTTPTARPVCGALRSSTSACSSIGLEQLVDALARARRDVDEHHVAAPFLGDHVLLAEIVAHAVGIRVVLVDLVDRDDDRHFAARACWIASIVCGMTPSSAATTRITMSVTLRAAGTHRREGGVARRVDERDEALRRLHLVGADVLRDAARLARRHLRAADVVEQRGLAVVDVTHDGHDRRTRQHFCGADVEQLLLDHVLLEPHGGVAEFLDDELRRVLVDRLVDRRHHAHLHHGLDDFVGLDRHAVGQFADRDRLRQLHVALDRRGRQFEAVAASTLTWHVTAAALRLLLLEARTGVAPTCSSWRPYFVPRRSSTGASARPFGALRDAQAPLGRRMTLPARARSRLRRVRAPRCSDGAASSSARSRASSSALRLLRPRGARARRCSAARLSCSGARPRDAPPPRPAVARSTSSCRWRCSSSSTVRFR